MKVIMNGNICAWAVMYYGDYGGVVECCNSGLCPSEEDFKVAEKEGCLAINGIAEDIAEEK